jgi:hypothetical protein
MSNLQISSYIEDQPTKCTFDVIRIGNLSFHEGATVAIKVDGKGMFYGYVFSKQRTKDVSLINVTCYDQLRYLKNKDSYVFENLTSDKIFSRICQDFVLKYKVVDKSGYVCAPRTNDGKALYDMIKEALQDTLINSKQWFIIRDNFGTLEHVNIRNLDSGIVLGDASGVEDLSYTSSIDEEVYNQIKLYRDNSKAGKRDIFIVNDTINGGGNLKKWGILQYYEKVDDTLNLAQIEQRARGILSLYNSTKRTLKLDCIGSTKVFAGCFVICRIADLGDISVNGYMLVTDCVHTFDNNEHHMSVTLQAVAL